MKYRVDFLINSGVPLWREKLLQLLRIKNVRFWYINNVFWKPYFKKPYFCVAQFEVYLFDKYFFS